MKKILDDIITKSRTWIIVGILLLLLVSEASSSLGNDNTEYDKEIRFSFDISSTIDTFWISPAQDTNDNVSQWIEILENRTQNKYDRLDAADNLGESRDSRAVKPFLKIIRDTEESDPIKGAVISNLGKVGNKRHTKMLIRMLDDDTFGADSATALGDLGDRKAVEPLMNLLANESKPGHIRKCSAISLGQIKDERAVDLLIECLDDEYISIEAAWALGEIGDEKAIEPLTDLLEDDNYERVTNSAEALDKLGAPAEDMLIENIDRQKTAAKINSIYALGEIGEKKAYGVLLKIAEDKTEHEEVRRAAIYSLGKIGKENAIEPLVNILEDENEKRYIRTEVPDILMDIDEKKVIQILIEDLSIENKDVRASILYALGGTEENDQEQLSLIIEPVGYLLLNDDDWPVRREAARTLASINGDNCSDYLSQALNDERYNVRYIVAMNLIYMADKNSTEPLISALNNETNKDIRYYMTQALGYTNDSQAVPTLIQLMQDRDEYIDVRIAATEGLGIIADRNATNSLMDILQNKNDSPELRNTAVISLGNVKDPKAVDLLSTVAGDETEYPEIRRSAENAIENMQETEVS